MSKSETAALERPAQHSSQHPVATILRRRGFVPLPRLWVRSEDMPRIHRIAGRYRKEVNVVRAEVGALDQAQSRAVTGQAVDPQPDPKTDREAARDEAPIPAEPRDPCDT